MVRNKSLRDVFFFVLLLLASIVSSNAQTGSGTSNYLAGVQYVLVAPSGACVSTAIAQIVVGVGTIYTCQSGTWAQAGGASGNVVIPAGDALTLYGANDGAGNTEFLSVNSSTNSPNFSIVDGKQGTGQGRSLILGATYVDLIGGQSTPSVRAVGPFVLVQGTGAYAWVPGTSFPTTNPLTPPLPDTAVSRLGAGSVGVGNGTQGDISGSITASVLINPQGSGVSAYTAQLTDADQAVTMSAAGASTFTIPTNASVAFPVGTTLTVSQLGAGQITLTPASGAVTINTPSSLLTRVQYSTVSVLQTSANVWLAGGDLQ